MDDYRPINERTGEVLDTSLVDDLADVLFRLTYGWEPTLGADLQQHKDFVRVMARYRCRT